MVYCFRTLTCSKLSLLIYLNGFFVLDLYCCFCICVWRPFEAYQWLW